MTATARATASIPEIVPTQHALIYLMVMVAASDGDMKDAEFSLIGDMVRHLPVFNGFDIETLPEVARSSTPHFADPDGHVWEVAWGPGFSFSEHGDLQFSNNADE